LKRNKSEVLRKGEKKEALRREGVSFAEICRQFPEPGETIEHIDNERIRVFEDWKVNEGEPVRILFCNAAVDEDATGWYLHSKDYGLKCILSLRSHDLVLVEGDDLYVYEVRVLRKTRSGKALVCEVVE